jgi:hypothetical protein
MERRLASGRLYPNALAEPRAMEQNLAGSVPPFLAQPSTRLRQLKRWRGGSEWAPRNADKLR